MTEDKQNDALTAPSFRDRVRSIWQSDKRRVRYPKKMAYRFWRVLCEGAALILGLTFVWAYGANYVAAQKKVDVSFLSHNVSTWFAGAFEGRTGEVGGLEVEWLPEANAVRLIARDIAVSDKNRPDVEKLTRLSSLISVDDALIGNYVPTEVDIDGGSVTWRRDKQGNVLAGLGTPRTVGRFGVFLDQKAGEANGRGEFSLGRLNAINVQNATIYIRDETAEIDFRIENAALSISDATQKYALKVSGNLVAAKEAGQFNFDSVFSNNYKSLSLELDVENLRLSEIAPKQGRFHELSDFDVPLTGSMFLSSEPETGLDHVDIDVTAGQGEFTLFGVKDRLNKAVLNASYDTSNAEVRFRTFDINSSRMRMRGQLGFANLGTPSSGFRSDKLEYDLDFKDVYVALTDIFDGPITYDSVSSTGGWIGKNKELDIEHYSLLKGDYQLNGDLNFIFSGDGVIENLTGQIRKDGIFLTSDFLEYWPTEFVPGARRWIFKAMQSGTFKTLDAQFDLDAAALSQAPMTNDQITVNFEIENADVKYMDHMPPYVNAGAKGSIIGNQLQLVTYGGTVGTMQVQDGSVVIPRLQPKGGDFTIDVNGEGAVQEMLRLIDNKPFEYTTRYGIKPDDFSGYGNMSLKVTRPLLEFFDLNRIRYDVTGRFENASAPFSIGEHKLGGGVVDFKADKNGLTIDGPVTLGPWRANLSVVDHFIEPRQPANYRLSGPLTREVLDKFGLGFREYFGGMINVDITTIGRGVDVGDALVTADLTPASLQIASYQKPINSPAKLTATVKRKPNQQGMTFEDVILSGEGLSVKGSLDLLDKMRLGYLNLSEAKIEGLADLSLSLRPNDNATRLVADVAGQFLDLSTFADRVMKPQSEPLGIPYEAELNLETLVLKPDFILNQAAANIINDGAETLEAAVTAKVYGGDFLFSLTPLDNAHRNLKLNIPDAGKVIYAFARNTRLTGGSLSLEGDVIPISEGGGFEGELRMSDFTVTEAPAFAQLLSFASLKGLFDTLSGSGVHFEKLKAPVEYRRGRIKLSKARMSGSALGMTADGIVNLVDRTADLDGVLVPSYTANSLLGDVPLIGDILVGKKGEGIFALSYSVIGPFDKTEITVNPLSALTPGFLRQIFEPNRKKDDEVMDEAAQEIAEEMKKKVSTPNE